jgi:hypothetical protein
MQQNEWTYIKEANQHGNVGLESREGPDCLDKNGNHLLQTLIHKIHFSHFADHLGEFSLLWD